QSNPPWSSCGVLLGCELRQGDSRPNQITQQIRTMRNVIHPSAFRVGSIHPVLQTLGPGVYTSTSSLEISSGDLTLDALGNSNAVFIFQMASTLTVTSGRQES